MGNLASNVIIETKRKDGCLTKKGKEKGCYASFFKGGTLVNQAGRGNLTLIKTETPDEYKNVSDVEEIVKELVSLVKHMGEVSQKDLKLIDMTDISSIQIKSKKQVKAQMEYIKRELEKRKVPEPKFTVGYMKSLKEITSQFNLNKCGRMLHLALYMDLNNDGLLMENDKPLKRSGIAQIWGLKDPKQAGKFLKELVEVGFLEKEGQNFKISEGYHTMGHVAKDQPFAKLYQTKIKDLATNTSPETLGLLYKIIPLVNMFTGTICENPFETDETKILAYTRTDLAKEIDVSEDTITTHMDKLQEAGAVLCMPLYQNSVYYKVHPDFVNRMDHITATALRLFINERMGIAARMRKQRKENAKNKK